MINLGYIGKFGITGTGNVAAHLYYDYNYVKQITTPTHIAKFTIANPTIPTKKQCPLKSYHTLEKYVVTYKNYAASSACCTLCTSIS